MNFRNILYLFLSITISQNIFSQTITIPSIFGSNMVLQQNTKVPVWGWAAAGTSVEVSGSWGEKTIALTGNDGKWKALLQTPIAVPGEAPAYILTIKGPLNTYTFNNVLVGEVWLCSGQSNMWFPMNYRDASMLGVVDYAAEIAAANYPSIRLFTVKTAGATTPQADCTGSWLSCSPSSISSFSAVAYYFGRELYNNKALNIPIALIHDSYSGSSIQSWMKDAVLQSDTDFKTKYINGTFTTTETKPSLLYNAMIAPIIPFAIKGVIWYQGESNAGDGAVYTKANIAMINDWRADWGTYFSFYAVQLTPRFWSSTQTKDLGYNRALFREAQTKILTLPKTGIVATGDLMLSTAELPNSHPRMKKEVGIRLALLALANDYGEQIQYSGPTYKSFLVEGNKIRVQFSPESLGSGLTTKDGSRLKCFKIAGADKIFYPASAVIDGNSVVVSSTKVSAPVAVRHAFTEGAMTNFQNNEGIATFPFRTDAWTSFTYADAPEDDNSTIPTPIVQTVNQNMLDSLMSVALVVNVTNPLPDSELKVNQVIGGDRTLFTLAMTAYLNPDAKSTNGVLVRDRVLLHIRNIISGGKEPSCRGDLFSWKEIGQAFSFLFAKRTPQLWSQLTDVEKEKIDLLMKSFAVVGNYQNGFDNWPKRCMYQTYDIGKTWNPNHNDGYVGIMIAAFYYFGSADAVNTILANFSYDTFMTDFQRFGFTNIITCWSQTGKILMETGGTDKGGGKVKGVRMPFTMGDPLTPTKRIAFDPVELYRSIGNWMYCHITTNTSTSGAAYILNNGSSPMLGRLGMCREFQITDGFPPNVQERSDATYSFLGWFLHIPTVAAMMALGEWPANGTLRDIEQRMYVGSEDLIYKLKTGYHAFSKGVYSNQYEQNHKYEGYPVVKELWNNFIKPRLQSTSVNQIKDKKISISPNPVRNQLKIRSDNNIIHRVDIVDYCGKTAKSFSGFSQKDITIDVSGLFAGNYLLSLIGNNNFHATEKIVKN
jgi:sialate O-acetylesterase